MKPNNQQKAQSNEAPFVTIWTSCYNHEAYLDDYLQGLLAQTYTNIQIILIDDGSTDGSWAKICSYQARLREKFPLSVIESHQNVGAVNEYEEYFWQNAAGKYLCLLDSDDYYLPTKIEDNVKYLETNPEIGAVHSDVDFVYHDRIEYRHWQTSGTKITEGDIFEALLLGNFIMTCSFMCRTDLMRKHVDWREYFAKGYIMRDYACFLDLARHTKVGYINKSLARYRMLKNSGAHSTNIARRYELLKNYHTIKLDYAERYDASPDIRQAALEHLHSTHAEYGYLLYLPEQFWKGYQWLKENAAQHSQTKRLRIRALSMCHKVIWRLIHTVEVRVLFPIYEALCLPRRKT